MGELTAQVGIPVFSNCKNWYAVCGIEFYKTQNSMPQTAYQFLQLENSGIPT